MTFEQFQATARHVVDLEKELGVNIYDDTNSPVPGIVYADGYYIEKRCPHWPEGTQGEGDYYLVISTVFDGLSHDLAALERELYQYAKDEQGW